MATSDTNVSNLIINKLSQADLDGLISGGTAPANQIFVTPDDDSIGITDIVTQNSTDLVTSGGVYTAIQNALGNVETLLSEI